MMYGKFARVYDALMSDVDYAQWAQYYLALAKQSGVTVGHAADCACGTGNLTIALSQSGIRMTGLDLSEDMLQIAAEKARALGMQIPFVRQDMKALRFHRPMDAIFCACDGVNYLVRPQDVQAFFSAAYRALRPGGGFFFDVSTRYKLSYHLGNKCLGCDDEAVSYLWQNHYDADAGILQMDITFFTREADGRYSRFAETHLQRAHHVEELTRWLSGTGFSNISMFGDRTFSCPAEEEQRVHLAAVRPTPHA